MCVNFLLHKLNYVVLKTVPHLYDTWFDSSFPDFVRFLHCSSVARYYLHTDSHGVFHCLCKTCSLTFWCQSFTFNSNKSPT